MFIYFKNPKDGENYCLYSLSPCINYKTQVYVTESLPQRKHKALLWYHFTSKYLYHIEFDEQNKSRYCIFKPQENILLSCLS